jgi:hypothetical protein
MQPVQQPQCRPSISDEAIQTKALGASLTCWETAHTAAVKRLTGLQRAVRVRERAIAKAIAAR